LRWSASQFQLAVPKQRSTGVAPQREKYRHHGPNRRPRRIGADGYAGGLSIAMPHCSQNALAGSVSRSDGEFSEPGGRRADTAGCAWTGRSTGIETRRDRNTFPP